MGFLREKHEKLKHSSENEIFQDLGSQGVTCWDPEKRFLDHVLESLGMNPYMAQQTRDKNATIMAT